jgi:hypothetical protein
MGQEDLVVLGCQGCHHQTKYNKEGANGDEGLQIALVKHGADNNSNDEKQKSLYRTDPRD